MFEDENTIVGAIPLPSTFSLRQNPSSSKAHFDIDLSSSSDEMEGEENQEGNNITSPRLETIVDGDIGTQAQVD